MKSWFAHYPIRWKIAAPMIAVLVVMLLAVLIYFPQRHKQALLHAQRREAQRSAELLSIAVLQVLQERDFDILLRAIQSVQRDSNILFLQLYDEAGVQLATYTPAPIPASDSAAVLNIVKPATDEEIIIHHQVVNEDKKILGQLVLGYSLRDLYQQLREYRLVTFIFTLVALLPGLFFINIIARHITQPISQLQAQMQETIAKGSYANAVEVASSDEVGQLASAFNQMMTELRLRHQRLAESQKNYRQLYEKLQALYHLKSIFVADASHHLRTPLTVISGEIEVTLQQERSTPEYQEVLAIIADETKHLSKIVDNLLTLGKAEAGNLVFMQAEVDWSEICARQIKQTRALAKSKNLQLEDEIAGNCFLRGDPHRLAELVANLLENAVKYTPAGGTIKTTLENAPAHFILKVMDTGSGIAPDEMGKIFERFYRGKNSRVQAKGAGLGLAICQSIVDAHGGTITVSSQEGKGSIFQVVLPKPS